MTENLGNTAENENGLNGVPNENTDTQPQIDNNGSGDSVVNDNQNIIDDQKFFEYYKEKTGKEASSFDDFFIEKIVEKEVVKEIDKFDGVNFDDDDLSYIEFKKSTGGTRKDFEFIKQDIESINIIDLASKRIQKETGQKLTKEQTIEYLEDKFDMDLSDMDNLSVRAKIDLSGYTKPIKDEILQKQEEIKNKKPEPKQNVNVQVNDNVVTLENGTTMPKERYEQLTQERNGYLQSIQVSADRVGGEKHIITIEDNGVEKEFDFVYEFTNEDKHSMLSDLNDLTATIEREYKTEKGFDTDRLMVDRYFMNPENREKLVQRVYDKAYADAVASLMKVENNVDFSTPQIPKNTQFGNFETKIVPINQLLNR